jgi:sulfoxide reductase catalytic subunit YedY
MCAKERRAAMYTRRRFTRLGLGSLLGGSALLAALTAWSDRLWAATRKILSRDTDRRSLIREDPASLDTTNLEITPLEQFETMGTTDRVVDRDTWRLEVNGRVGRPLSITYAQLTALPSIERTVLLICPGFFANHGRWKGVLLKELLEQADFDRTASQVVFEDRHGKSASYPLPDVLSGKVFLAYQVNGTTLPRKHGFPLRVVADGYYGAEWVKYVDRVRVEKT